MERARKILVIPDSHVMPHEDLRRFELLGEFILSEEPDVIVQIGDFMTLDAFSEWDMNKRAKMEGRRYEEEIRAASTALDLIFNPMLSLRERQKEQKRKQYSPEVFWLEGNHEDRETRYLDYHPELIGTLDYKRAIGLTDSRYPLTVVRYKEYVTIGDIGFTHIPITNNNSVSIGGKNVLAKALDLHHHSVVFGHTHRLGYSSDTRHGSPRLLQALNVGCYIDVVPEYARGSLMNWWAGLVMIHQYENGPFDFETFSMNVLKG